MKISSFFAFGGHYFHGHPIPLLIAAGAWIVALVIVVFFMKK
jgi:hypothetical protein